MKSNPHLFPLSFSICLFFFILCTCTDATLEAQVQLSLEQVASGFNDPTDIVSAGDERLFIVEQNGRIRIIDGQGDILPEDFLNINVNYGAGEQGMLGMVFHPDYASNGYFYVNYTAGSGDGFTRIERYSVDPNNPNKADPNSAFEILTVTQPAWNHNAGDLVFGPDGYLYIGFGDGGSGNDPWGNGQNPQAMLGKMLRIDVDNGTPYAIPPNNPFVNDSDVLDEIWALGMRNPWRYSFDRLTGDMWIGDVGQNDEEEIDYVPASSVAAGGFNFGWDCYQGYLSSWGGQSAAPQCNGSTFGVITDPIHGYDISNFCNSVTGGYVYRGCEFPDMYGRYFYADFCNGIIWSLSKDENSGEWVNQTAYQSGSLDVSTFGEDHMGNLYVARYGAGVIYKLVTDFELEDLVYDEDTNYGIITAPAGYEAYQWYQNGNLLNGATGQTLEEVQLMGDATYYCVLTHSGGSCTFTTNEVSVIGVGLEDIQGLKYFEINPNPFSGKVMLTLKADRPLMLSIDILDVNGDLLIHMGSTFSTVYQKELDLSHLMSGVYFVRLRSNDVELMKKLVKY